MTYVQQYLIFTETRSLYHRRIWLAPSLKTIYCFLWLKQRNNNNVLFKYSHMNRKTELFMVKQLSISFNQRSLLSPHAQNSWYMCFDLRKTQLTSLHYPCRLWVIMRTFDMSVEMKNLYRKKLKRSCLRWSILLNRMNNAR